MTYIIRTARKDKWTMSGIIKKGEKYIDKGFGQIQKIKPKNTLDNYYIPKEDK